MLVAITLIASGAAASVAPSARAAQCRSVQNAMGKWSAIDIAPSPSLPVEGVSMLTATSLVGQDPNVVLSTDGLAVYRSTDGGCKWSTTYTLGAADYWNDAGLATAYTITNIVNGHSAAPAAHQTVYLAVTPNPYNAFTMVTLFGAAPPELFMVSHDGGQTFAPVQPAPSAAHPIVPECLSAPQLMVVPAAESQKIYLQCPSGVAQGAVDRQLASGEPAYRSIDGGQSWSLVGFPAYGQYDAPWFVAGPKVKEIWLAGDWYNGSGGDYLAVWHTLDDGAHWTMSKPATKPGLGIGTIGVVVDPPSGTGDPRVIAFAPIGAFVSTDGAKHWAPLRETGSAAGLVVLKAFFVRHTAYVIGGASGTACKPGITLLRYADPRGRPVKAPFPTQWGTYYRWGNGATFAPANGGSSAFGVATFCSTSDGPTTAKLLTFQPR